MMRILAFETSCDDTAIAIVEDGTRVLASICLSQTEHTSYGGVVPEIAARLHAEHWRAGLEQCLRESACTIDAIDYFAVTQGPGLQTSLLTGTTAASFLSLAFGKPLIPVHHIYGHMCANFLERAPDSILFPGLVLVASGGHTELHLWRDRTTLQKIGQTLDDAAGEAFDKVAKMLGLGYPGGPIVSQYAEQGDSHRFDFPVILLDRDSLDFSFSGLKAAIYRMVCHSREGGNPVKNDSLFDKVPSQETNAWDSGQAGMTELPFYYDLCASFQRTVQETLCKKVERALLRYPSVQSLHFVGGVSSNTVLSQALQELCTKYGKQFFTPVKKSYSTDNAAMIGSAAYGLLRQNPNLARVQFIEAEPRLAINGTSEK